MGKSETVEALDAKKAVAHSAEWRALAENAAEPNAFYEPAVTLAALKHLNPSAKVLMARRNGQLIGVWPVMWRKTRFGVPLPLMAVEPSYAPISTPLLDKKNAAAAAKALLGWVRDQGAVALLVPKLSDAGEAAHALRNAVAALGGTMVKINAHERAVLAKKSDGDISGKLRREHERLRRRLAEQGKITVTTATSPKDADAALTKFLALEQSGWKGRSGAPMIASAAERAFITEAVGALAKQGGIRVVLMNAGGRPIAGGLVLTSGRRAFYFKTAYDESLAKFAPGVLVTEDITQALLNDADIDFTDSLADPGHPLMERVWHGRMPVADWIIAPNGDGAMFRMIVMLEKARQCVRTVARKVLRR